MPKPIYILAFCGHRNLPDNPDLKHVLREAIRCYASEAESRGGELHFHSMIAWGADLIAIEQAHELKIPVHLILPKQLLPVHEDRPVKGLAEDFRKTGTNAFMEDEWLRAMEVIEKSRAGHGGGSLRTYTEETQDPDCFHDTAVKMLSASDALLAVWDGHPAKGIGGCGETCQYAKDSGIPTWRMAPEMKLAEFRRPSGSLFSESPNEVTFSLLKDYDKDADSFLEKLDSQAEAVGQAFRGRTTKTISLHFYATLLAAFASSFVTYDPARTALLVLSFVQGTLVTIAWWTQRKIRRSNAHTRWVNLRFAAELTRSAKSTAGISDPMYPQVAPHLVEWSRFARTISFACHVERDRKEWEGLREHYLQDRLRGQISYFDKKKKAADKDSAALRRFLLTATQLAPWVAAAGITYKLAEKAGISLHDYAESTGLSILPFAESVRFLPIALPLIAGFLGAKMQASDAERRRTKYANLAAQLQTAENNLVLLRTEASTRLAVARIEEILLGEQLEWLLKESPTKR